jgi:hypothetical protein
MRQCDVRTPEQALAYITECNLATVSSMAMHKSRSKSEFARQISIAQIAIDWMMQMNVSFATESSIMQIVSEYGSSVKAWSEQYIPKGE